MEDRNKMKIVLRLAEKPRNKDFGFLKLIVKGMDVSKDRYFLEFSKDEITHINIPSLFDDEKRQITIYNLTITVGGHGDKDYRRGQPIDELPEADRDIIREVLESDNSTITVIGEDWFESGAEFLDWR